MKALRISLLLIAVLALLGGIWFWSDYCTLHPNTDDAYVEANTVYISPQVAGQVAEVMVKSFQPVKKGDVLLRMDLRLRSASRYASRSWIRGTPYHCGLAPVHPSPLTPLPQQTKRRCRTPPHERACRECNQHR